MNTLFKVIFLLGFIAGAITVYMLHNASARPVMLVEWGSQSCISVNGDASKCNLYSKDEVIIKNSAF